MPYPFAEVFEKIYATDLTYVPHCHALCGDAHCCSGFPRVKKRLALIGATPGSRLPLLPGELDFLQDRGWTEQFGDFEHAETFYQLDRRRLRLEELVVRRGECVCQHDTRLTVCRLYPLLPVFAETGAIVGIDSRFGIYDELEAIDGTARACQINALPLEYVQPFFDLALAIASEPILLFYALVYQRGKSHVAQRVAAAAAHASCSAFRAFETALVRNRLFDPTTLRAELVAIADAFEARYGDRFRLEAGDVTGG